VIFEDSAALLGMVIAGVGIYLTDHQVGPALFKGQPPGAFWDGAASMTIGVVLAIVAFSLARSSRGLLLGEAAIPKSVERIRQAILSHEHVCEVVELLTMHLAPKQILINAHVNFRNELATDEIEQAVKEVEALIKKAEPKVDMIFLETARESTAKETKPIPQHIG
jgi:divalent metal cation (Fe/Co/Zn/Cd) transporter